MLTQQPPVRPEDVFRALQALSSQDPAVLKGAEEQLKALGDQPNTWDVVHQFAAQKDLPIDLRKQALIQFKNLGVTRWRSRRLFNDEIKPNIRIRSYSFFDESDEALSETNAVVLAKLARADFPHPWSTMATDLTQFLENALQMHLQNVQIVVPTPSLRHVLRAMALIAKELSGMKMVSGLKAMQQLVDSWFTALVTCYSSLWAYVSTRINASQAIDDVAAANISVLHMIYKPLSRMSFWLWTKIEKPGYSQVGPMLLDFFQNFRVQWNYLSGLRQTRLQAFSENAAKTTSKHLIGISKTFRKWQRNSSERFFQLPESAAFVLEQWKIAQSASASDSLFSESNPNELYPLKLIIVGLAMFKESIAKWASPKQPNVPVLSEDFVGNVVETIVKKFLPLKQEDLTKWEEDPEEWAGDEEIDEEAWEFGIRPCSERVLMVTAKCYPQYAVPTLQRIFSEAFASGNIFLKESVYCAMGCCIQQLKDQVNFDDLLATQLSQEVIASESVNRILKRRVAWLIGKWISSTDDAKPTRLVWEILTSLLTGRIENTDPVVHTSVIITIKQCADSLRFEMGGFSPFIGDIIQGLIRVAKESETVELKQKVLSALDIVIERAGNLVAPFSQIIINVVPDLWSQAESNGDFLIKGCLLQTLEKLVMALRDSQTLRSFLVPLLQTSFSPLNKSALEEDALKLWLVALRNAASIGQASPDYMDLLPFAIQCLSENLDIMGTIVQIIEAYMLLNVQIVVTQFSEPLLIAFEKALSQVISTNIKDLMRALNLLATLCPIHVWAQPLLSSGLFAHIMKNLLEDKQTAVILTEHIFVLARIAISDPSILLRLVASVASVTGKSDKDMFNDLLDQWWLKFDNMSEASRRKLTAMGAACLVATGEDEVLKRLPSEIFNLWLDCFGEIREAESEEGAELQRHWQSDEVELAAFLQDSEGTLEEDRRRHCFTIDPVQVVKLTTFVAEKLNLAQVNCGGPEIFKARYLQSADETVMKQIEKELMS